MGFLYFNEDKSWSWKLNADYYESCSLGNSILNDVVSWGLWTREFGPLHKYNYLLPFYWLLLSWHFHISFLVIHAGDKQLDVLKGATARTPESITFGILEELHVFVHVTVCMCFSLPIWLTNPINTQSEWKLRKRSYIFHFLVSVCNNIKAKMQRWVKYLAINFLSVLLSILRFITSASKKGVWFKHRFLHFKLRP